MRVVDLAKDMIRRSRFAEEDINIAFTGSHPGEKLYELDTSRKSAPGWRPNIALEQGLRFAYADPLEHQPNVASTIARVSVRDK